MDSDQKFLRFIENWAKTEEFQFVPQGCDGRESPELIDGMAVDDVWGWLLPEWETELNDEHFGCVEWSVENGELKLQWKTYD